MKKQITEKEIENAAKALTMDNFFSAAKELRCCGVLFYDEEHNEFFRVMPNVEELAEHDPELINPNDSLESVLYGVFEVIRKWDSPECETCNFYRNAYKSTVTSRTWSKLPNAWAHRALVSALEMWLRIPMEDIMLEQIKHLSEADVIKRCNELDNVRN